MITGERRGELCALRWDRIDFATDALDIRTVIAQINTHTWEKGTKTHQRQRIVVDRKPSRSSERPSSQRVSASN